MVRANSDREEIEKDLALIEHTSWALKAFSDRISAASQSSDPTVIETLRLDAMYKFAEFYFLLWARRIETGDDLKLVAEIHNSYIVGLTKDKAKMARMKLKKDRLLQAIFTADTLPRLQQTWEEAPGTIDQSNLARLLAAVMSTETTRKLIIACQKAGFLDRRRTAFGTMVVSSTGVMEGVFGELIRELRFRIEHRESTYAS